MRYFYLYPTIRKMEIGGFYKEKRIAPLVTSRQIKNTAYNSLGEFKSVTDARNAAVMRGLIRYDVANDEYVFTTQGVEHFI